MEGNFGSLGGLEHRPVAGQLCEAYEALIEEFNSIVSQNRSFALFISSVWLLLALHFTFSTSLFTTFLIFLNFSSQSNVETPGC